MELGADDEYDDDSMDSDDSSGDSDRLIGEIRIQPDFNNSIYSGIGDIQDDIESEPEETIIESENDANSDISGEDENDSIDPNILEIENEIIGHRIQIAMPGYPIGRDGPFTDCITVSEIMECMGDVHMVLLR